MVAATTLIIITNEILKKAVYNINTGIYRYEEITGQIINAAHTVHNKLGYGFLEKVYHNALVIEIRKKGLLAEPEKHVEVKYDNQLVGEYFADIVVDNKVIIEVKSADQHNPAFEAQLLNYLKATGIEVGLIINFGSSVFVKRMVL
jgi:GxxExxY protein